MITSDLPEQIIIFANRTKHQKPFNYKPMEQLPLTFNQATVEPDIQECYEPAFNFTRVNSSNGRLAFTADKIYWLPDAPMAMLDQGWVIRVNEVESCAKYGISGFLIKLKDGKDLRFSNVGSKMREGITEAIESRKEAVGDAPVDEAPIVEAPAADHPAPAAALDSAPEFTPEDASANKWMAVLAYLGILVLIPLFVAKESKFARFHVNQGLILLICSVVSAVFSRMGWGAIAWILNIVIFVLAIIGIINAVKGEAKELPVIGKFKIIS